MCGCISGGIAAIYIEEIEMREKRAMALFFELNFLDKKSSLLDIYKSDRSWHNK